MNRIGVAQMVNLFDRFSQVFGYDTNIKTYFSPGRINLIGEHIDYSGGLVFPAAIQLGTYGAVAKRTDSSFRFYSDNFENEGIIHATIKDLLYRKEDGWANYAKGVILELIERGFNISHGFDLYVNGTLPTASGLSSSASIELLISWICNDMFSLNLSRQYLAMLSQHIENNYMGMHCGIMDQLIIAEGLKDRALLMNTATLETTPVKAKFDGFDWVIMNTNNKRKTTDSKYNERRSECDQALIELKKFIDVEYLCELTEDDFLKFGHSLSSTLLFRRAKHAITEQSRTLKAKIALENQDAMTFAQLLNESHASLRFDYEVTGIHLDTIVSEALKNGAIGARVTGAGFGGCAIALVPTSKMNQFSSEVGNAYQKITGIHADFYQVTFENGVNSYED